jgi:hypothetical protein
MILSSSPVQRSGRGDPRVNHARRTRKRRLPVTFDMLFYLEDLLLQSRHVDDWMTYLGILMAFHFMLRVSEYCLDGSSPHAIRCSDVLFLTDDGSVFSPWDKRLASISSSSITGAIIDLRSSKADKQERDVICMFLARALLNPSYSI